MAAIARRDGQTKMDKQTFENSRSHQAGEHAECRMRNGREQEFQLADTRVPRPIGELQRVKPADWSKNRSQRNWEVSNPSPLSFDGFASCHRSCLRDRNSAELKALVSTHAPGGFERARGHTRSLPQSRVQGSFHGRSEMSCELTDRISYSNKIGIISFQESGLASKKPRLLQEQEDLEQVKRREDHDERSSHCIDRHCFLCVCRASRVVSGNQSPPHSLVNHFHLRMEHNHSRLRVL